MKPIVKSKIAVSDNNDAYSRSGVNIDAGDAFIRRISPLASSTRRTGALPSLGGFGGLFDLGACGFKDPVLVAATDGVGTKLILGQEHQKFYGLGIDLVAMCVNDLVVQGAQPLFFLDYIATSSLNVDQASEIVSGIADGCRQTDCALIGGETAELPGLYPKNLFDLAGFAVGAVERDQVYPKKTKNGQILIGLSSSGLHSNGFSLVRKIINKSGVDLDLPAPFSPDDQRALIDVIMEPTRLYVKPCLKLMEIEGISAFCHITGGGLLDNIPRVLQHGQTALIDAGKWPLPPLFHWLADKGNLKARELARTFNCGIGMVLVIEPAALEQTVQCLEELEISWHRLGEIVENDEEGRLVEIHNTDIAWPCLE